MNCRFKIVRIGGRFVYKDKSWVKVKRLHAIRNTKWTRFLYAMRLQEPTLFYQTMIVRIPTSHAEKEVDGK